MSRDDKKLIRNSTAEFLIFTSQAGEQGIEARYEDETVWLTQKLMATLFDVDIRTISEHLKNIFLCGELHEDSVIRKFRIIQTEGTRTEVVRTIRSRTPQTGSGNLDKLFRQVRRTIKKAGRTTEERSV